MLGIGDPFPKFDVAACVSTDRTGFTRITNETYAGKWTVYVFYPKDFTFLCPTELAEFAKKHAEFIKHGVVFLGGSTDNEFCHQAWRKAHPELHDLPYPLLAAARLAVDLGILHPRENACMRATFIVDPNGIIQWVAAYPPSVGRSVPETLRVLDALLSGEECPCNWEKAMPSRRV